MNWNAYKEIEREEKVSVLNESYKEHAYIQANA